MDSRVVLQQDKDNRLNFLNSLPNDPLHKTLLAQTLDATLLGPQTTPQKVENLCLDAIHVGVRSVCVPPAFLSFAQPLLKATAVRLCTVTDFPLGHSTLASKMDQVARAREAGAVEIDFVHNAIWAIENLWDHVEEEYTAIHKAAGHALTKVILETALLTPKHIEECSKIAQNCGISIVKTSTGFGARGASIEDIETIQRSLIPTQAAPVGIKASGGVRSYAQAISLIQAGATRIGTSQPTQLLETP